MLNSLCFTPEVCEVIHKYDRIIKSLCWYESADGEKQTGNTVPRDVWQRSWVLLGEGETWSCTGQKEAERICLLQSFSLPPSLPLSPTCHGGERSFPVNCRISFAAVKGMLFGASGYKWDEEEMPFFMLCVCRFAVSSMSEGSVDVLQDDIVHHATLLLLCLAIAMVALLSFSSSLQGAQN